MRRREGAAGWLPLLALVGLVFAATPVQADEVDEYELKAAFLYNFAKFVQWPEGSAAAGNPDIRVCVLGSPERAEIVVAVMEGKEVEGRALNVQRLTSLEEVRGCNILFVARDAGASPGAVAGAVGSDGTLTVGETPGFARRGGIVNFVKEGNKVRFEINQAAARRADLSISSKLLRLAKLVDR